MVKTLFLLFMNKKFVINLGLLLLLNFLVKPFYILGIDAEIQNQVGQEVYGQYFSLLGLSFLLNIILDVGIVNYNTRNIAQHGFLLQKYFSHIIGLRLVLSILFTIVTFLVGLLLGYDSNELIMLSWLIINQILASLILYIRSNLAGLHLFKRDSVVSVLDRFLLIIICGILLWGGVTKESFKIEWFIFAQTFTYSVTLLIALTFLITKQKVKLPKFKKTVSISIIKQSFPYALLILLMTIYYRSDSVMLERILDDGKIQAGIYANGFRFFEAANNIALLFATLLLPLFAKQLKINQSVNSLVGTASRLLLSGGLLLTIVCFFFQDDIIGARYTNYTDEASPVFGLLMICFFFISCTYIFGTLLTANGNLKTLNKIAFAGVVLNIGLNLLLIPTYKAYGAALASLITQAATALAQIMLSYKYFKLTPNVRLITALTILAGAIGCFAYYLKANHTISGLDWVVNSLILFVLGIIIIVTTKIVSINHLKTLILSFKTQKSE